MVRFERRRKNDEWGWGKRKTKGRICFIFFFFANFNRMGETKKLFLTDDKPSGTGRSFQKWPRFCYEQTGDKCLRRNFDTFLLTVNYLSGSDFREVKVGTRPQQEDSRLHHWKRLDVSFDLPRWCKVSLGRNLTSLRSPFPASTCSCPDDQWQVQFAQLVYHGRWWNSP